MTKDLVAKVGHLDLKICQLNAQITSSLTKSIYSCKNAVYKGRILQLVKQYTKEPKANDERETNFDKITKFEIMNVRVIVFDSTFMENESLRLKKSKSSLFDTDMQFENSGLPRS
jgi:hypothetical protein